MPKFVPHPLLVPARAAVVVHDDWLLFQFAALDRRHALNRCPAIGVR